MRKRILALSLLFILTSCYNSSSNRTFDPATISLDDELMPDLSFHFRHEYIGVNYGSGDIDDRAYTFLNFKYTSENYFEAKEELVNCNTYHDECGFEYKDFKYSLNFRLFITDYVMFTDRIEIRHVGFYGYNDDKSILSFIKFDSSFRSRLTINCWEDLFDVYFDGFDENYDVVGLIDNSCHIKVR